MNVKTLKSIDGVPLDGLEFCARAFSLFDSIYEAPGGKSELRLRSSVRSKRLMEEILPIAAYVQAIHSPALRLIVTWRNGNQRYDAHIRCVGKRAALGEVRKQYFLEVTTSGHENDYLVRENVDSTGGSFAPRNTKRDRKSKQIISVPSVYSNDERERETVEHVDRIVAKKRLKPYQAPTVLLVQCSIFSIIGSDEWGAIVESLKRGRDYGPFKEVYILEPNERRLARIYASPMRRRRPTKQSNGRLRATRSSATHL